MMTVMAAAVNLAKEIAASSRKKQSGFRFKPFSDKQKKVLTWWTDSSLCKDLNGIIADGSIRSGKTTCMSLSFVMWGMTTFNDQNFGICGKTIGSLRRNVVRPLLQMLRARGYKVKDRRSDNLLIVRMKDVENRFYLFGGKDESSQDLIQGITLAGVLFDEVALMPESFVNQATARCSVEGAKHWFNCNPDSRMHWFKQKWINKYRKKGYLYLHFLMDDNPSLSEAKKEFYKVMYVGMFYRRFILGQWVAADGVIYDMFSKDNLFTEDPGVAWHLCRRYVAVDYGTTNPMVFLDAWDDETTFWIRNEYYYDSKIKQRQKTDAQYADDFEEFVGHDHNVTVILDPSAVSFRLELRNRGYHVKEADNEVRDGIRMVSTLMQKRRIMVHRRNCPKFQKEVSSYIWDEKAIQRGVEQPVKANDHAMDAMRYLIKTIVKRRRLAI